MILIKNHYRFKGVDLRRQKELESDPKSIQQIESAGQLKKLDVNNNDESMFILTSLEKVKESQLKLF